MEKITTLKLIDRKCPVCLSDSAEELYSDPEYMFLDSESNYYIHPLYYVICNKCGQIYNNPSADPQQVQDIYAKLMIEPCGVKSTRNDMHFKFLTELLHNYIINNKNISLLEVGSGSGGLLLNLSRKYKRFFDKLDGIEPSYNLANYSNKIPGINVENKYLENLQESKLGYDVILLDNVFEHFDYPGESLKIINNLLNENGRVYVSIPNIYIKISTLRDPLSSHPCNYTIENVQLLLNSCGFWIESYVYREAWINMLIRRINVKDVIPSFDYLSIVKKLKSHFSDLISSHEELKLSIRKKIDNVVNQMGSKSILALYGAGEHTIDLLNNYNIKNKVSYIVDSNDLLHGQKRYGIEVFPVDYVSNENLDCIILSSATFQTDMKQNLINLGVQPNKIICLYD